MTRIEPTRTLDERLIDRIVDGELTPAELRTAIASLEPVPDGWKRCTLAFLEAQCLRESFRSVGERAASAHTITPVFAPATGRIITARRRWLRGPLAAGIVAASFAMGWLGHAARPVSVHQNASIDQIVASHDALAGGDRSHPHVAVIEDSSGPRRLAWSGPGEMQPQATTKNVIQSVGRLHFGPPSEGADVPIFAVPGVSEQWLRSQPPPVSEHAQVALQRQGYHVDQSRQFITRTLDDGRRVAVPVDQVQIRFTGNNPS